ncbi:unnamed protein product [Prorocentrum cordatum]|uniref:Uncharacterized protein n=1 Tax=Prorocentrum cordatum TaxID=2364126 RepID=A0ABN9SS83_9DINO|nr:unnamed protein product [Polarella glacialis]
MSSLSPYDRWQIMLQALVYFQSHFWHNAAAIFEERLFSEGVCHRTCAELSPTSPSFLQLVVDIERDLRLTAERCDVILPSSLVAEVTQQRVAGALRPGCPSASPSSTPHYDAIGAV